jgi:predicted metal-dependent hydrolase
VRNDGSVRVTIPSRGSRREALRFYESQRDWVHRQQVRVAGLRAPIPADLPTSEKRRLIDRARVELSSRLLEIAQTLGLAVRKVSIRDQRHRWGSCSPSGHICLNWRLVTMPSNVRDYVLYHELMHLRRMDHSPQFWKLVAEVCPDYEAARQWLRCHGRALHTAGEEQ